MRTPEVSSPSTIHRRAPRGGLVGPSYQYKGGQFISRALWEQEKERAVKALPKLLQDFSGEMQLLRRFYVQNSRLIAKQVTDVELVPLTTIEARMKTAIRNNYARAFLLGKRAAGNLTSTNDLETSAILSIRKDEYTYLRRFLGDMRIGSGKIPYMQRMDMYTMSSRELFWAGYLLGDLRSNRQIRWRVNPEKEHCKDCLRLGNAGWLPVQRFVKEVYGRGFLPQGGRLDCKGYRCGCHLEDSFT